jgi:hypothetical protein
MVRKVSRLLYLLGSFLSQKEGLLKFSIDENCPRILCGIKATPSAQLYDPRVIPLLDEDATPVNTPTNPVF